MKLKEKNKLRIQVLIASVTLFCLGISDAQALSCASGICPEWSKDIYLSSDSPNQTLLQTVQIPPHLRRKTIQEYIVDPGVAAALRARYEVMLAAYEYQKHFSLSHPLIEQKGYFEQNKEYTYYVMRKIVSKQVSQNIKSIRENNPNVLKIARDYDSVGKVANGSTQIVDSNKTSSSAPSSAPVKPEKNASSTDDIPVYALVESAPPVPERELYFKAGANTNIAQQKGQLWVLSDIANASVTFKVGEPWGFDPWAGQDAVNIDPNEDYQVGVSRSLVLFGLDGGVSYSGTSTRMSAVVGKNILSNLRAEYQLIRGVDPAKSSLPVEGERIIRMNYGVSF